MPRRGAACGLRPLVLAGACTLAAVAAAGGDDPAAARHADVLAEDDACQAPTGVRVACGVGGLLQRGGAVLLHREAKGSMDSFLPDGVRDVAFQWALLQASGPDHAIAKKLGFAVLLAAFLAVLLATARHLLSALSPAARSPSKSAASQAQDAPEGADGQAELAGRWPLIMASALAQVVAGAVYAMGAWQGELRDALGSSMGDVSTIAAATFLGSVAGCLGGLAFDRLGPRASVAIGGGVIATGNLLIMLAVVATSASQPVRLALAATGALFTGYASVTLLDNVVCMACSLSFPSDRAGVVGYLKAVLATSAGLWAILWVHVFQPPDGPGLLAYLGFVAAVSLVAVLLALYPMAILPEEGSARQPFTGGDLRRLAAAITATVLLSLFDVTVSFLFSRGLVSPTPGLGYAGMALAALPFCVLLAPSETGGGTEEEVKNAAAEQFWLDRPPRLPGASSPSASSYGMPFGAAMQGLDFWLLWFVHFAIFGSGVATNQNLSLILESAGDPSAAGLGVALFALASSVSRMVVGILSDQYGHVISRFNWIQLVAFCGVASQLLVATMQFIGIMLGVLLAGISFGAFFTVIVPVVNEMYGRRQFGVIMGSQLASQAFASVGICKGLLPTFYRLAAGGESVCIGESCFRSSFLALAALNALGLAAAATLEVRNRFSMPLDRMHAEDD